MPQPQFTYLLHTLCEMTEWMWFRSNESSLSTCCLHVNSSWTKSYCNEDQLKVLYLAPLTLLCTLSVEVVYCPERGVDIFLTCLSIEVCTTWINCQNVLSLLCLQMQECEKYLKFVVFDLYISWLVSSASINDCLNKTAHSS